MVRFRTTPSMPVAQNTQPMAQPTCVLMQTGNAVVVAQQYALDLLVVVQFEQQFFSPVGRFAVLGDRVGPDLELGGQLLAERRGQVGHLVEAAARRWNSHFRTCPAR